MAILVDKNTKVICQGFTGSQERFTANKLLNMVQKWLVELHLKRRSKPPKFTGF